MDCGFLLEPLHFLNRNREKFIIRYLGKHNPKKLADRLHKKRVGHHIDWENPTTLNEKINWLKFYSDTSLWSRLSDKYAVRGFVKEKGLSEILIPLLGHWSTPEKIEWDTLPKSFILKATHGSGDAEVVKDKDDIDRKRVTEYFRRKLSEPFGLETAEPHYLRITPSIVAEELLDISAQGVDSTSIVDYKIWCFDGKAHYIWTCANRKNQTTEVMTYDIEWNAHPEFCMFNSHYKKGKPLPKPQNFDKMIEIAEILSDGFPCVRVDLYNLNGRIYFGEMTFTSLCGYMNFYTDDFQKHCGSLITLPK